MEQKYIDASTSSLKFNLFAFLIGIILFIVAALLYILLWGTNSLGDTFSIEGYSEGFTFLFFLLVGIWAHELLHGLGYIMGGVNRSELKYGFNWKNVIFYVSCKVPVTMKTYKLAGILPLIVLGVFPTLIALLFEGLGLLFFWSLTMLMMCSGDIYMLLRIRNFPLNSLVIEHPKRVGCYVLENN